MRVSPFVSLQHSAQSDILYASLWSHFSSGQSRNVLWPQSVASLWSDSRRTIWKTRINVCIQYDLFRKSCSSQHIKCKNSAPLHHNLPVIHCNFMTTYHNTGCCNQLPQVHRIKGGSGQQNDHVALQCHCSELENNHSWKKVNGAFRGCAPLSSTWTGPKYRSVGGFVESATSMQPSRACPRLKVSPGKTAVRLTSASSNQTEPAACQCSPTEPFSLSAWSCEASGNVKNQEVS